MRVCSCVRVCWGFEGVFGWGENALRRMVGHASNACVRLAAFPWPRDVWAPPSIAVPARPRAELSRSPTHMRTCDLVALLGLLVPRADLLDHLPDTAVLLRQGCGGWGERRRATHIANPLPVAPVQAPNTLRTPSAHAACPRRPHPSAHRQINLLADLIHLRVLLLQCHVGCTIRGARLTRVRSSTMHDECCL